MWRKFSLIFAILLNAVGCSQHEQQIGAEYEKIQGFFIQGNNLYALGEKQDYHFTGQDVVELNRFINSPYIHKKSRIYVEFERHGAELIGHYSVYIQSSELSSTETQKLIQDYDFKFEHEGLLRKYKANGKHIRLENRNGILQKYKLKKLEEIRINNYEIYKAPNELLMIPLMPVLIFGLRV